MKKILLLILSISFSSLSFANNNTLKSSDLVDTIYLGETISVTLTGVFELKNYHLITDEDGYLVCNVSQTNPNGTFGSFFFLNWEGGCCGDFIASIISGTDVNQFIGNSAGAGGYNITLENGSGGENTITFTITLEHTGKKNDLEPNDTYENANLLQVNSSKTGHINFVDPSNRNTDVIDIYKISVASLGNFSLKLSLTPSIYQTEYNLAWIALLDSNLNFIAEDSALQNANIIYNNLNRGLYYIRVIARLRQGNPYIYGNGYKLSNTFYSNNQPTISISNKSILEGNTSTKQLNFPVTLSNAYINPVTIKYKTFNGTATAGSDYVAKQGTLTFNPGDTVENISIIINGDTQPEANEKFLVRLGFPVNATIADERAIGTIRNDDAAFISSTTSDNINTNNSLVSIYPNPVKNTLFIQSKMKATFSLRDALGRVVLIKQINGNGSIDVSKLSSGLYFLRNNVTSKLEKIIVEK